MPVSFFGMSATGTALAGVFRINRNHLHTEGLRLVSGELLQLAERPAVEIGALFFAAGSSVISDTSKVFNRNRWIARLLGKLNDPAANDMILVSLKAPASTGQPFQGAPCPAAARLCLLPLERSAYFDVARADLVEVAAPKEALAFAIGDGRQHIDATVYAYHGIVGFGKGFDFALEGNRKVYGSFSNQKPSITELPAIDVALKCGCSVIRDTFQTSVNGPDTQALPCKAEVTATNTTLQGYTALSERHGSCENLLGRASGSIFTGHLPNAGHRDLRGQAKRFSGFVAKLLKLDGIADLVMFKGDTTDRITSICPRHHGTLRTIERNIYLDQCCSYYFQHKNVLAMFVGIIKFVRSALPCRLKATAPCA